MTVHPSTEAVEAIAEADWRRRRFSRTWNEIPEDGREEWRERWHHRLTTILPVLVAHGWTPPQEGQWPTKKP